MNLLEQNNSHFDKLFFNFHIVKRKTKCHIQDVSLIEENTHNGFQLLIKCIDNMTTKFKYDKYFFAYTFYEITQSYSITLTCIFKNTETNSNIAIRVQEYYKHTL